MDMFRTLKIVTVAALTGMAGLLTSCLQAPDYPDTPHIDFKEVKVQRYDFGPGRQPADTVAITIDFTDGNGDLGLGDEEKSPPYNNFSNGVYNRTGDNYFITVYKRSSPSAAFEAIDAGPQGYNSRFPKLYTEGAKPAPLKGSLTLTLGFFLGDLLFPGDEVRFDVSIMDRALNESNKISTSSFIVQPR